MTDLNGSQIKQIYEALKSAFPSEGALKRMLILTFGENSVNDIDRGNNYSDTVLSVIRWARAQGLLDELIRGALTENPHNLQLREVAALFLPEGVPPQPSRTLQTPCFAGKQTSLILGTLALLVGVVVAYFVYQTLLASFIRRPEAQVIVTPSPADEGSTISPWTDTAIIVSPDGTYRIHLRDGWGGSLLLPTELDPARDSKSVITWLAQPRSLSELLSLPRVSGSSFGYGLRITNDPSNKVWLRLENSADVTIQVSEYKHSYAPVVYSVGGGGGNIRFFSTVPLIRGSATYTRKAIFKDFDFFTLQPGEFEELYFTFQCSAPGDYQVTLKLKYDYLDQSGEITGISPQLVCPDSFTRWETNFDQVIDKGSYIWDGSQYALKP